MMLAKKQQPPTAAIWGGEWSIRRGSRWIPPRASIQQAVVAPVTLNSHLTRPPFNHSRVQH
eukprot:5900830-Pyramimonas_sp.AAC.1